MPQALGRQVRTDNYVLLIDDDARHASSLRAALVAGAETLRLEWMRDLSHGLEILTAAKAWAVFVSVNLPDSHGLETLDRVLAVSPQTPVIVICGTGYETLGKAAMARGATDYLVQGHLDAHAFARAIRSIVEREMAQRDLFIEKERAQITLNSIGDAVMSVDAAGRLTYMNPVAEAMTGWSSADAVGKPAGDVFRIIDGATRLPMPSPLDLAVQADKPMGLNANCLLIRRDGHETSIEDSTAPIHDRDGQLTGAVIVFHDVSVARSMVLEMARLAQHDLLTDLPNRLLLNDRLTQAILRARRNHTHLAVLFLDLDGFKRVNDTLGHIVGDKLLQSVARSLSASIRKSDTVSRHGGDEFIILLSDIANNSDAATIASKIISKLTETHVVDGHLVQITASVGISTFPEHGQDAETLIKSADTAMYGAKELGRNTYQFFSKDMALQAVERQSIDGELRYAVERDELILHYQPKVDLKSGLVTGVEALMRWRHPTLGLLLPGQFLSAAESSGMIVPMGRWVLEEACHQTQEWIALGLPPVPVAVNISSVEFRSDQFLQGVQGALRMTGLDPALLEIELTESVMMTSTEATAASLRELNALGVRLAIDDFGTGYSSLSYLTSFPVDFLKLDRSFVHNLLANPDQALIVSAVIGLGRSLKHRVVAEGVETVDQLAFLRAQNCDEGQGYLFSPPVAPQQFTKILEAGLGA